MPAAEYRRDGTAIPAGSSDQALPEGSASRIGDPPCRPRSKRNPAWDERAVWPDRGSSSSPPVLPGGAGAWRAKPRSIDHEYLSKYRAIARRDFNFMAVAIWDFSDREIFRR